MMRVLSQSRPKSSHAGPVCQARWRMRRPARCRSASTLRVSVGRQQPELGQRDGCGAEVSQFHTRLRGVRGGHPVIDYP